jgi:hypothetical protein
MAIFLPELLLDLPWEEKKSLLRNTYPGGTVPDWITHLNFSKEFPQGFVANNGYVYRVFLCGCGDVLSLVKAGDSLYERCTIHGGKSLCLLVKST